MKKLGFVFLLASMLVLSACGSKTTLNTDETVLENVNTEGAKDFMLDGVSYDGDSTLQDFLDNGWVLSESVIEQHTDEVVNETMPINNRFTLEMEKETMHIELSVDTSDIAEGPMRKATVSALVYAQEDVEGEDAPAGMVVYGGVQKGSSLDDIVKYFKDENEDDVEFDGDNTIESSGVAIFLAFDDEDRVISLEWKAYVRPATAYRTINDRMIEEKNFMETAVSHELKILNTAEITSSFGTVEMPAETVYVGVDSNDTIYLLPKTLTEETYSYMIGETVVVYVDRTNSVSTPDGPVDRITPGVVVRGEKILSKFVGFYERR